MYVYVSIYNFTKELLVFEDDENYNDNENMNERCILLLFWAWKVRQYTV